MNLLQDIIKILHQPVQLLIAALMFAYKEPKRKFWLIRAVLAAILGFLVLKICITASPEILLNSFLASLVWSIGSFLILLSIEYSMFDVKLKMAAYFTTLAYLTQHVAFCAWDAIQPGAGYFIRDKLHLEMSEEKTLITHGHDAAKFLGYEVTIAKGEHNKKTKTGATRRVNNGKVLLYVPHDKWVKRLFSYNALKIKYDKQNGNKEVWEPVRRTRLLHLDDLESPICGKGFTTAAKIPAPAMRYPARRWMTRLLRRSWKKPQSTSAGPMCGAAPARPPPLTVRALSAGCTRPAASTTCPVPRRRAFITSVLSFPPPRQSPATLSFSREPMTALALCPMWGFMWATG